MQVHDQKLFDYSTLEEELDADCAAELARSFMEDGTDVMTRLIAAVESKDQEGVRSNAHKLRGACRSINAAKVESQTSQLEDAAVAGDWDRIHSTYSNVRPLYDALCAEITAYLTKG
jgi:HPt (histidine-containing phosphotransfer) domain-containing protein